METKSNGSEWNRLETEIVAELCKISKAKDFAIGCLAIAVVAIAIGMGIINFQNDKQWRELFASYDYVSQDGEGQNYYNSNIDGDVNNGTENPETEKQIESERDSN